MAYSYCMRAAVPLSLLLSIFHTTTGAEQVWSPWYNSNPGRGDTVENETLDRIAMTQTLPCPREGVVAVQCRVAGSNVSFSGQFRHGDNVLHVPCNLTGLLCLDHDQILAGTSPCRDYELRVLCLLHDEVRPPHHPHQHQEDEVEDLGVKGGFTAMVAGGSVVIPLTCVLVFQLRRYKREERQRQQQARQSAQDNARAEEGASSTSDAPPTYEALFGQPGSLAVISDGVVVEGGGPSSQADGGAGVRERLLAPASLTLEGRVNPGATVDGAASSGVSSSSLSSGTTPPVSAASSSVQCGGHGSSRPVQARCGSTSSQASTSSSSSTSTTTTTPSERRQSSGSSTSSSSCDTSSTDTLMPPTPTGSDLVTHRGPPPAYEGPEPSHVTLVMPGGENGAPSDPLASGPPASTSTPLSSPPPAPSSSSSPRVVVTTARTGSPQVRAAPGGRRFLGMHLSIFDLMAALYPDPAAPTPTPPPSYDEALKILEASRQPQVRIT